MKRPFIPFGYKLMLTYFLFVLIPVIVVGSFSYQSSIRSTREQTRQNLQGTLSQIRDNISYKMSEAERVSEQLYYDEQLQNILSHQEEGWSSYETTKNYLMPMFTNAVNAYRQPALLKVFIHNTSIPEVYSDQSMTRNPLEQPGYEILYLGRLGERDWLAALEVSSDEDKGALLSWQQVDNDQLFSNISVIRRLVDFNRNEQLGLTRTIVKLEDLLEAVDYKKIGEKSSLFVLDQSGAILKASGRLSRIAPESEANELDNLKIIEPLRGADWSIVAMVPNSMLEKNAKDVLRITIVLGVVSIIIVLVVGLLVSNYFSKRVRKIVYSLHAFKEGDFQRRITIKWNDEFSQIADAFNKMGDNVEELIKEVYIANIQKKEAELESLQAQINPHFLYNTLSSISRLAKFGEIDKLHEMVMGLAKFYRLTLNKGRMLISVGQELEQVGAYIDIQNIKYRNRLQIWYDVQFEVLRYETVKLILQPFVENALEHALFGKSINIRLVAQLEKGMVVFKLIDDGVGMSQETIDQIFARSGVHIGYGIRNVDERIKLQYGDRYGVTIFSRLGIGTCITIRVPAEK